MVVTGLTFTKLLSCPATKRARIASAILSLGAKKTAIALRKDADRSGIA
jgi:hypothetical protein